MFEFAAPAFFYYLPLPLLIYWLIPVAKQQQASIRVPFYQRITDQQSADLPSGKPKLIPLILLCLIWLALVTAAARPHLIGKPINIPQSGRDLMLAVDLSGSMKRPDMQIGGDVTNRLVAVKAVVSDFISRREGDRIGLIVFGSQAYVQAPLTFDRETVKRLLLESQIGFAGENTAIGDAIGLSVKRLRNRPGDQHILVLLTDGANTAGEVTPLAAARIAAQSNIKIYTIGIGADEMVTTGVFGFGGRTVNPSADLDENTLTQIAESTGGRYFRAKDPEELQEIYQLLDKLEPIEEEQQTFRPKKALFYWPLGIAFGLSLMLALIASGLIPVPRSLSGKKS